MPVLSNHRHERFAQQLAKGKTADEAYVLAGFEKNRGNASRLKSDESIDARVREILGAAANRVEITTAKVLEELAKIGFANMQDYMSIGADGDPFLDFSNMNPDQAAAIVELTVEDFKEGRGEDARDVRRVKMKLGDKRGALVDIGRHLKMFTDKVEHSGTVATTAVTDVDEARAVIARFAQRQQDQAAGTRH